MNKYPTFKDLLKDLEESPLRAARRCRDAFQTSAKAHYETVHETIAFIVAFVLHLERSAQARTEFLADHYWDGKPQRPKEKNLTRLAAMYMVGAKQSYGALYQQALQYTKVAEHFLTIDIEPEAIPEELRRKPIYKVLDKLEPPQEVGCDDDGANAGDAQVLPKAAPNGATVRSGVKQGERDVDGDENADEEDDGGGEEDDDLSGAGEENRSDDDDDEDDDNDDDDANGSRNDDGRAAGSRSVSSSERTTGSSGSGTSRVKRYPFKQSRELAVEAEVGWKLFFDRMQPYDEAPVMIRRLPDENGWAKFEISDLLSRRDYRTTRSGD